MGGGSVSLWHAKQTVLSSSLKRCYFSLQKVEAFRVFMVGTVFSYEVYGVGGSYPVGAALGHTLWVIPYAFVSLRQSFSVAMTVFELTL